jgi:hypothetical protein
VRKRCAKGTTRGGNHQGERFRFDCRAVNQGRGFEESRRSHQGLPPRGMRQSIKTQAEALTGNFADMRTFRLRDRLRQALRLWTPSDQGNFVGLWSSLSAENVSSIEDRLSQA